MSTANDSPPQPDPRMPARLPRRSGRPNRTRGAIRPFSSTRVSTIEAIKTDEYFAKDRVAFYHTHTDTPASPSLKPIDPPDLNPRNYERQVREFFQEAFAEEQYSLEDLTPFRIAVAWRITRELARHMNLVRQDELLVEVLNDAHFTADRNPWLLPQPINLPNLDLPYYRNLSPLVFAILRQAEEDLTPQPHRQPWAPDPANPGKPIHRPGLAILPPPVPLCEYTPSGDVAYTYDPANDLALAHYLDLISAIAEILRLDQPLPDVPHAGRYGLTGLLDPDLVRIAFPSPQQIMAWEELVVEDTLQEICDHGIRRARSTIIARYGLRAHEADALIAQARVIIRRISECETEDERALMAMRLDGFMERARQSLDLRAELGAMKQLSIVHGLAKVQGNDTMTDIINTVKMVSNERQQERRDNRLSIPQRLLEADSST